MVDQSTQKQTLDYLRIQADGGKDAYMNVSNSNYRSYRLECRNLTSTENPLSLKEKGAESSLTLPSIPYDIVAALASYYWACRYETN